MARYGPQTDEKRPRCSYYDALAAIGLMKGIAMVDVARDDALIGALMEMEFHAVRRIVETYDREELGYPTAEKVAALAGSPGSARAQTDRGAGPEPQRVISVETVANRLLGVAWGVITGLVTALAMNWMPLAWLPHMLWWLVSLPADFIALLFSHRGVALVAVLWT
jgi:hypothetical protein